MSNVANASCSLFSLSPQYEFTLENWVLRGLQGGYPTQPQAAVPCSPSGVLPSCPPYWMLFSSPQLSRLASRWSSDLWEPNPRRRCRSLNASHLRNIDGRVRFTISDSDSDNDDGGDGEGVRDFRSGTGSSQQFLDLPGKRCAPAQSAPSKQQQQQNLRKNVRQASLSTHTPTRPPTQRSLSLSGYSPSPSNRSSVTASKKSQAQMPSIKYTKPSVPVRAQWCPTAVSPKEQANDCSLSVLFRGHTWLHPPTSPKTYRTSQALSM